jgi:RimJ/RimL family protein N-acetyltransferase
MPPISLPGEPLVDGPTALRPWRDSDIPALVAIAQDPEISRWTRVPFPYGETDGRAYLLQRYEVLQSGAAAPLAIISATDDTVLLGSISLMRMDWQHARGEVGYWVGAEARGAGHATRAVRLICDWGFEQLALERIELLAAIANPASQRVAERAGFTREAVLRSYLRGRDGRQDMVAFGLLVSDLESPASTARRFASRSTS